MQPVKFKTEQFEGPLDLLLHLLARHRMDVYEIRIYELIDQYLAVMETLGPDELDPTSEFIEMAARLVHMKSAALLPRREEAEQLERELTGQLVEYHLCKQAAARLRSMSDGVVFFVREPLEVELSEEYDTLHDPFELLVAAEGMSGRAIQKQKHDPTAAFDPIVAAPVVSVTSRIVRILRGIRSGSKKRIQDFFLDCRSRSEAVATFLGVLELIRAHRIQIDDEGTVTALQRRRQEDRKG